MRVLILNRKRLSTARYDIWLRDQPHILLTLFTKEDCLDSPPRSLQRYEAISQFRNYDGSGEIEWEVIEEHQKEPFDRIIALSEVDILRAARLRSKLGLPGQGIEEAAFYRDKVLMKTTVQEAGLLVPPFQLLHSAVDLYEFIKTYKYPVVVKPTHGAGATGTKVLRDPQDAKEFVCYELYDGTDRVVQWMVEAFVDGEMYHVDGLMWNGIPLINWPSRYVQGCLSFREGKALMSTLLDADDLMTQRLRQLSSQVLRVLPLSEGCAFHLEVFHTKADELVFCESASRVGGLLIDRMIERAFGWNLNKISAMAQAGLPCRGEHPASEPKVQTGLLAIPSKASRVIKIPNRCHLRTVVQYQPCVRPGTLAKTPEAVSDVMAIFVVEGISRQEVERSQNEVVKWFYDRLEMERGPTAAIM